MPSIRVKKEHVGSGAKLLAAGVLAVLAAASLRETHISAQDFPSVIGRIEGDAVEVATTTPLGVEKDAAPTVVASGSDVTLRSGHALVMLNAGGEISVCGPAHFKLIQSSGAVALALDYGRVHPSLESSEGLTIYTPGIVATPIAIAGGTRDMTLGLNETGDMCVLTSRGAMRVEPQFTDQSMIVPQGGSVSLMSGQVASLNADADASACSCDYPRARLDSPAAQPASTSPAGGESQAEISLLASAIAPPRRRAGTVQPSAASGKEPIYTVLMPALSFSAKSPQPPAASASAPETVVLVREVQLRPLYEFHGHVNPAPEPAAAPSSAPVSAAVSSVSNNPVSATPTPTAPQGQLPAPKLGLLDRLRDFFRKLATSNDRSSPCAGFGCKG